MRPGRGPRRRSRARPPSARAARAPPGSASPAPCSCAKAAQGCRSLRGASLLHVDAASRGVDGYNGSPLQSSASTWSVCCDADVVLLHGKAVAVDGALSRCRRSVPTNSSPRCAGFSSRSSSSAQRARGGRTPTTRPCPRADAIRADSRAASGRAARAAFRGLRGDVAARARLERADPLRAFVEGFRGSALGRLRAREGGAARDRAGADLLRASRGAARSRRSRRGCRARPRRALLRRWTASVRRARARVSSASFRREASRRSSSRTKPCTASSCFSP